MPQLPRAGGGRRQRPGLGSGEHPVAATSGGAGKQRPPTGAASSSGQQRWRRLRQRCGTHAVWAGLDRSCRGGRVRCPPAAAEGCLRGVTVSPLPLHQLARGQQQQAAAASSSSKQQQQAKSASYYKYREEVAGVGCCASEQAVGAVRPAGESARPWSTRSRRALMCTWQQAAAAS
eukprot:354239-Chlamydomonas_euryale.AAC.4